MSKLFFELRDSGFTFIAWKEYTETKILRPDLLWIVRNAVYQRDDLNLPRKVGITADEASEVAKELCARLKDTGMIVY